MVMRSGDAMVMRSGDVMSAQRRAKFDQYGEAGLKQGVPNGKGGVVPGWSFNKNPELVFAEFFGGTSPFAEYGYVFVCVFGLSVSVSECVHHHIILSFH